MTNLFGEPILTNERANRGIRSFLACENLRNLDEALAGMELFCVNGWTPALKPIRSKPGSPGSRVAPTFQQVIDENQISDLVVYDASGRSL